ncbi:MAG: decarboxylase [Terriglobia bacterium]|nr:MAG: decarboxylase [Terriglobia bacterium]
MAAGFAPLLSTARHEGDALHMKLVELFRLNSRVNGSMREPPRGVRSAIELSHRIMSQHGEVSGNRLTHETLKLYQAFDQAERAAFFDLLAREFSPNPDEIGRAADAYRKEASAENLARLERVVEPPRRELFRRLNMAPGATSVLVEMRGQLLQETAGSSQWAPVAADLTHLLTSWFNRGFLVLQRIDWRTPANILEKLIRFEAVHQIQGWNDLRRRLAADRRCYGFFHPALPDDPIIFIEVALTRGMSDGVQPLLDPDSPVLNPQSADCAMFYSITNCHQGLRGVPLGSFLIKQVVEDLGREFPRLRTFATISPAPKFRAWLANQNQSGKWDGHAEAIAELAKMVDEPQWFENRELPARLQRDLTGCFAYYLLHAKQGERPYDPVARFHLRNGARLERINWLGDKSMVGIDLSAGFMVNYVYRLAEVARNHELYMREHRVAASRLVTAALSGWMRKTGAIPARPPQAITNARANAG